MNKIYCSTGALIGRPNGRDYRLLSECIENIRCDGYEFMMYDTWYEKLEALREFFKSISLSCPVFHVEKGIGELISMGGEQNTQEALRLFDINCALARELGSKILVFHLWSGRASDSNIDYNIECYPLFEQTARKYGLVLTVENVVCNQKDPLTHLKTLAKRYPNILFTFDTKMAEFHGQTVELYKPENRWLAKHIAHVHANDYGGGYMDWSSLKTLHIGEGTVDFDLLFAFLKETGYKGDFTLEATSFDQTGAIHFEKMIANVEKLENYCRHFCL